MAIGATIFRFHIELSDVDRGVFEALDLHVAKHPSESTRFLVVRVLARCLEHAEGIELTKGVSDTELPALVVRDLQGGLRQWVEVGVPAWKRVHKATSRAAAVAVYAHKQADVLRAELLKNVRKAEAVRVVHFDDGLLETLETALERNATWSVTRSEGTLYVDANGTSAVGAVHDAPLR